MARYIDESEIKFTGLTFEDADRNVYVALSDVRKAIAQTPTADVVEVKHGEWILHKDGSGTCKVCGKHQKDIWDMDNWQNYCGHCGAKMDGGARNGTIY